MKKLFLIAGFLISTLVLAQNPACYVTKNNLDGSNFIGYTTSIQSVVCNTSNNTHTITLRVAHNGCPGPTCKELSHFSVEADNGTYSNVSVTKVSGSMAYGNIDLGPNLGSDPFDGFKVDNTSNIGDGKAGVFTITYTLSGGLQDQQVNAKAGPKKYLTSFTVADFTSVMNCNSTSCNVDPDTDGDGIADVLDDYPNDITRAFNNYYPAPGNGTLAFEDLWPSMGDFDMNDLIMNYRFNTVTNGDNNVVEVIGTFTVRSFGASFHNGFGFQLPNNNVSSGDMTVSGYSLSENYITLDANGLETGQNKPTVIVYDNTFDFMPYPGSGIGVNTDPAGSYVSPVSFTVTMSFNNTSYTAADVSIENFNPFIIVRQTRGTEVHLPNYEPTAKADLSKFGTMDDNSGNGNYYVTEDNLPWALNLPAEFSWPKEKVDIIDAYNFFEAWVESNGQIHTDWYTDEVGHINQSQLYDVP